MNIKINSKELCLLLDLEQRLQDDYNNNITFKQHEEDRLLIGDLIDKATHNQ